MRSFASFVSVACLLAGVSHAASIPTSLTVRGNTGAPMTDFATIFNAVYNVNQKSGASANASPNQPVPPTSVTATDGNTNTTTVSKRANGVLHRKRLLIDDYTEVFAGGGTGPNDRDASVEASAYLTYTLVSNYTYNVIDCLHFCDSVQECVFANLYYEFNNYLLDFVFSEKSNLKCAIYGDVATAAEKTNFGGQQSYPAPAPLTYIQDSSGYAAAFVNPPVPDGYELVYGPTGGANNAPGYMGFVFLDRYDVETCAGICEGRAADPVGGECQYFNIWRAVVNGVPTTYTCSLYYLVADPSTAVNTGQGSLVVTYARGYRRQNLVPDGDFEGSASAWTTSSASIVQDASLAYSGSGVAIVGTQTTPPAGSSLGSLTLANPLSTKPGFLYDLQFFASAQPTVSGTPLSGSAVLNVLWNNVVVISFSPQNTNWGPHAVSVTAKGNDVLSFVQTDGTVYTLVDNVSLSIGNQ